MNIHFGVDYYPEHWPMERWETDAGLMKEMGIQVVRLAEFSWYKMEPQKSKYDFTWLEKIISIMGDYGIKVILGTPSAAPPAWMVHETPEILPIDKLGRKRGFGGRHHDCQSNQTYRNHIQNLVTEMVKKFAKNEHVIGWQIDNELGNSHHDLCMCDSCKTAFQKWLKDKYETISKLNHAWGTAFWSQGYHDFTEIFTPMITVTGENPSAMLDWKCFCSDLIVEFQQAQIDIIRKYCPDHFITHNCMGFADKVNYYDLAKELDFVSHDHYPGGFFTKMPHEDEFVLAAMLDLTRSFKKKPFWIMEQQSGITGWEIMGRAPIPGQLSIWAEQSIAHGADAVVFFRWRTCTMGTEQYWHGILPHSGIPGRRYFELKDMMASLSPFLDDIQGSKPKAEVAIVFSYRQEYAIQIQPQHPELNYLKQILKYYKQFYSRNIPIDFVQDTDDLSQYKMVIAPLQYLMTPELEEHYFQYVSNGGNLILTMRTGVKDQYNLCVSEYELPGRLGELCGIEILDYDCLNGTDVKVNFQKKEYTASKWCDIITLKGANSLAEYASEFYQGTPCVTKNEYGAGNAYYIGTEPEEELMGHLMEDVFAKAQIDTLGSSDAGVELMIREKENQKWLFAMNFTNEIKCYKVGGEYEQVLGNTKGELSPFELHLYRKA